VDALRHELIGALAGTKGAVDNLNNGAKEIPKDRDRFIESIALQTQRMLNLIRQLNDLSQLGVESLRDRKERVDLAALVNDAVDELKKRLQKPSANITVTEKGEPVEYMVVPELINLVIENLVRNALRHTPASGSVHIDVLREGTGIQIVVRDNGEGISERDLPHIFDRFFTTVPKNKVSSSGSGLGLGLAIDKQIVEAHDGSISCKSAKNKGAKFSVVFK
jgi:signal transduction histidine kinase